ncbi:MAG: xanthine dehydrogenase family protein subunit M [Planctomycetes bacterium]|nr:xanthine dehydrogenase family protein subunit M [Planctomycetota bacterium]
MAYEYHRSGSLEEALVLAAGDDSALIAGGTDLLVALRKRKRPAPRHMVSIRSLPELAEVSEQAGSLHIGAGVPMADVLANTVVREHLPALTAALAVIGSRQIRNVATLGGNLCNASPAADSAPPLLVYEATLELAGSSGRREIAISDFFLGPGRTVLRPGEIMTAIRVPLPGAGAQSAFLRRSRVAMDLATASLAAAYTARDGKLINLRLAAGAVAPTPLRLRRTEAFLEGKPVAEETLAEAAEIARSEVAPISDLRGSEWYRRELIGVFLSRALRPRSTRMKGSA